MQWGGLNNLKHMQIQEKLRYDLLFRTQVKRLMFTNQTYRKSCR